MAVTSSSAAWRRAWTVFCDAAISGGWDPGYGTRLVGDLEALDLADLQVEVIARLVRGDPVGARLFADSLLRLEERMLALGARDDDLAETQSLPARSDRNRPRTVYHDRLGSSTGLTCRSADAAGSAAYVTAEVGSALPAQSTGWPKCRVAHVVHGLRRGEPNGGTPATKPSARPLTSG